MKTIPDKRSLGSNGKPKSQVSPRSKPIAKAKSEIKQIFWVSKVDRVSTGQIRPTTCPLSQVARGEAYVGNAQAI